MKSAAFVVTGAVLGLSVVGCTTVSPEDQARDINQLSQEVKTLRKRNEDLEAALAGKGFKPVAWDDWMKELEGRLSDDLKKALADFSNTPGVTSLGNGGFRFEEGVLFDPGKASVKTGGQDILKKFAAIFKGQEVKFRVDGHTDSDKIIHSAGQWKTKDNLELAFFRAFNVREALKTQGIGADRMWIGSFGEHAPIATNDTKANKAKNRRVEIWVQPAK